MNIDLDGILTAIRETITDERFLIGSALVCMLLAIMFFIRDRDTLSRIYVMIAGANLVIQAINVLGVI